MKKTIETKGETPSGRAFSLVGLVEIDEFTGAEISICRRLEWAATETVGAIGIPLRADCPWGALYYELTRLNELTEPTRAACLL